MSEYNPKNISYSVRVDYDSEFRTEPLQQILTRRSYSWVQDHTVSECYGCSVAFSVISFIRKHHCRLCGRIYCYNCSNYYSTIPDNLLSKGSKKSTWKDYIPYYTSEGPTKHRVCKNCNDMLQIIQSVKYLIESFKILKLNIKYLLLMSRVCKVWQYAANYILSIFREIQYKLPTDNYTVHEVELLINNCKYIAGHNKYMVHLLKIYQLKDDNVSFFRSKTFRSKSHLETVPDNMIDILSCKNKKLSCWSMMCSRNCKNRLTSFDAFNLLLYSLNRQNKNKHLEFIALNNLTCSDIEFKCYIPILSYYLKNDDDILSDFLIKRCSRNFSLFSSLYWELQYYLKYDNNKIYQFILDQMRKEYFEKHEGQFIKLTQQIKFVDLINDISKSIWDNINPSNANNYKLSHNKNTIISPLDPEITIKDIITDNIKIKNSATRPISIPYHTSTNKIDNILYKHDDVKKDHIIMNIIRIIDLIIKQDEQLDLDIVTYNILPLDKNSGLIKIIDECDTIYCIKKDHNTTILNYIMENNGEVKIKELRDKFIKSTAAYCVITYVLGIGDRHLDNIMITRDGKLFHIDYGYILGKDPNYSTPGIRITPDIIETMGGVNSIYYTQFTELCTRVYNCLRRNIDIIMNMILMLSKMTSLNVTENEIIDHIIKRFIPGENYINAKLHFEQQLENQSYTYTIKDWCHYVNKENKLSLTSYFYY